MTTTETPKLVVFVDAWPDMAGIRHRGSIRAVIGHLAPVLGSLHLMPDIT
jgi:hypothetical protein